MNSATAVDNLVLDELLEGYLQRMVAPEPADDAVLEVEGWWQRGALIGLALGLGLGLAWYLASGRLGLQTPSSSEPAVEPASDPKATLPIEEPALALAPVRSEAPESLSIESADPPAVRPAFAAAARPLDPATTRPRVPTQLLRHGWRMYRQRDYQAAAIAFGRAVHSSPRHTGGYYGLALSLFEQGREDVALQVLERGARMVGPKAGLWVLAGSIYQWMGKERMARMAYQRYLNNNPRGAYARDVRVILANPELPKLLPFDSDETVGMVADEADSAGK